MSGALSWGKMVRVAVGTGPLVWLATGSMVKTALAAARGVARQRRVECPLPEASGRGTRRAMCAAGTRRSSSLEEHSVYGGLGSADRPRRPRPMRPTGFAASAFRIAFRSCAAVTIT